MQVAMGPAGQAGASPARASADRGDRLVRAQLSIKAWIENKAAMPAFLGLVLALTLRSAQVWSFGAFSLAAMPLWLQIAFDAITGFSAALAMELLMSAAGAKWWSLRREAIIVAFDTSISKQERMARKKLTEADAWTYLIFTGLGALASITGSVYFAVTSTRNASTGAIVIDLALAGGITFGVFFFGVIYEPARPDAARQAQDAVEDRLNDEALHMAGRVSQGQMDPRHIAFLKGVVSPGVARRLDALMPRAEGVEYWDTPRIMRFLGLESDAAARDIRRKLQKAAQMAQLGVRRKPDGRGYEAPQSAILEIFGADIERQMRLGKLGAVNGDSAALADD